MKSKAIRILCHVCFYFYFLIQWPRLDTNELQIIAKWMTSFIKFVFRLFNRALCLSISFSFSSLSTSICISLYTLIQSQDEYIYMCILTNDSLTQEVIFLLCPIHLTFITDGWFIHFLYVYIASSTCLNGHIWE